MTETEARYMRPRGDDASFGRCRSPAVTHLLMGSESDDIDAGWDEVPASAVGPSAAARTAPSPASAPPVASGVPVTPTEAFEPFPLVSRRPGSYVSSESLSPSEVTTPPPSVQHSAVSRYAPIAVIVALAAASIVWVGRTPNLTPAHPVAAAQPVSESVPRAPAEAPPAPAPEAPAAPVAAAPKPITENERLEIEPLVLEAPNRGGVTVRSIPEGAIFFEAGKRLGTGTIHVNVLHDGKVQLTALLNGYQPLNFKIDGSRDAVTVRLTPVGEPAQPATESPSAPASAPVVPQ